MHLFIDTNVYLNFYHFGSDALEELRKLSVAVKSERIKLYVPNQVFYEFKKRRETVISDALKKFKEQKMPRNFPQICRTYEEYQELRKAVEQFEEVKKKIIDKLNKDIEPLVLVDYRLNSAIDRGTKPFSSGWNPCH